MHVRGRGRGGRAQSSRRETGNPSGTPSKLSPEGVPSSLRGRGANRARRGANNRTKISGVPKPQNVPRPLGGPQRRAPNADACKLYVEGEITRLEFNQRTTNLLRGLSVEDARACVDEMQRHDIPLNKYVMRNFIKLCGDQHRMDRAFEALDEMERDNLDPGPSAYNAMIAACISNGLLDPAFEVFDRMRARNVEPDAGSHNLLMKACIESGDPVRALEIFDRIGANVADARSFNIAIGACAVTCEVGRAFALLDQMKSGNVPRDMFTYSELIKVSAAAGYVGRAFSLLEEMESDGVKPSPVIYAQLIQIYADAGRITQAAGVLDLMKDSSAQDAYSAPYLNLLTAYAELGSLRQAEAVIERMKQAGVPRTHREYTALAKAYGEVGLMGHARGVLQRMQEDGVMPDAHTFRTLVIGYGKVADIDSARAMAEQAHDNPSYSALMDIHAGRGEAEEAFEILAEMERANVVPDGIAYATVAKACGNARQLDRAFELLAQVARENSCPLGPLYTTLITECGKADHLERAFALVQEMKDRNIARSDKSYGSLIGACGRARKAERISDALQLMKADGIKPTQATYKTVINACANAGALQYAFDIVESAKADPAVRHARTLAALVMACSTCAEVDVAIRLLQENTPQAQRSSIVFCNALIFAHARAGKFTDASETLDTWMREYSVSSNIGTLNAMIDACRGLRDQDVEPAFAWLERMKMEGIAPTPATYTSLIALCTAVGNLDRANQVFELMVQDGLARDLVAYSALISACERHAAEDPSYAARAIEYFEELKSTGRLAPDAIIYSALISACEKGQRQDLVEEYLLDAVESGVFQASLGYSETDDHVDFHVGSVLTNAVPEEREAGVSASMASAIFRHLHKNGKIGPSTAFIVGHNGDDAIGQAIETLMREHGMGPSRKPGNPGVVISRNIGRAPNARGQVMQRAAEKWTPYGRQAAPDRSATVADIRSPRQQKLTPQLFRAILKQTAVSPNFVDAVNQYKTPDSDSDGRIDVLADHLAESCVVLHDLFEVPNAFYADELGAFLDTFDSDPVARRELAILLLAKHLTVGNNSSGNKSGKSRWNREYRRALQRAIGSPGDWPENLRAIREYVLDGAVMKKLEEQLMLVLLLLFFFVFFPQAPRQKPKP